MAGRRRARPGPCCVYRRCAFSICGHVRAPRPGRAFPGSATSPPRDLERLSGQALAVLPDPVRVDGGDPAGRRGGDVREHGQGNIEVVVGVRAPGQAPFAAHLRHAHRALHASRNAGSASGMSTDCSCSACPIWRQSVAIMLVAVGRPVARRNSAITSRPEKPLLGAAGIFGSRPARRAGRGKGGWPPPAASRRWGRA